MAMAVSCLAIAIFLLLLLVLLGPFQSDALKTAARTGILSNPAGVFINPTNSSNAITRLSAPSARISFTHGVGPPAAAGLSSISFNSSRDQRRHPNVVTMAKRSHSDAEDPNRHNKQQIDALFEQLKPKKPTGMSQANWEKALETTRQLMEMMPYSEAKLLANNGGRQNNSNHQRVNEWQFGNKIEWATNDGMTIRTKLK